ncbi:MAG: BRCT domain-containing protein, partial [Acidimicrobiia bacterium]
VDWAADPANRSLVDRLAWAGVQMAEETAQDQGPGTLDGAAIVVSGTLSGYSREEAEAAIEAAGGRATGSVSARTTALVVGEAPGQAKVTKAENLGVPIIDETTFDRLLSEGLSVLSE